jgi:hypothetical protein
MWGIIDAVLTSGNFAGGCGIALREFRYNVAIM